MLSYSYSAMETYGFLKNFDFFHELPFSCFKGYPKDAESSSRSTDHLMNRMISSNSQKATKDDEPLDDIVRKLLEEQNLGNRNQKWSLTVTSPVRGTTVTELGNSQSVTSWQTSQPGPARSQMVAMETVSTSTPLSQTETSSIQRSQFPSGLTGSQRSPPETAGNKWGLSKPRMWSCEERKNEVRRQESPHQRIVHLLSQELPESASAARVHSPVTQQPSDGSTAKGSASGRAEYHPRFHDTLARSKSSDYRNCASDSEDPMSWLEEQHSKLRMKRDGTMLRQRSQQEKRLLSELKTAQNTIRRNKRSQSDTEDASPDDYRVNAINGQTLNQVRVNIGQRSGTQFGPRDQIQTNGFVAKGCQRRTNESEFRDIDVSRVEDRQGVVQQRWGTEHPRHGLSSSYTGTIIRNGRAPVETSQSNGVMSPPTPRKGERTLEAVTQTLENNFTTMKRQGQFLLFLPIRMPLPLNGLCSRLQKQS